MRRLRAASSCPLALFLVLLLAGAAAAQEEIGGAGSPFASQLTPPADSAQYRFSVEPGGRGAPDIIDDSLRGVYVVHRSSADTVSVTGRAGEVALGSVPILLNSGIAVPYKLWDVQVSGTYAHQLGDRRKWGFTLGSGSASDVLFNSIHETEFRGSVFYQMPSRQYNSWLFSLNYSNNRTYFDNVPLPGVAYIIHDPEDRLDAVIGFPFLSARWRPDDDWTLSASVTGFVNLNAEVMRRLSQRISIYARIERQAQSWLRVGRTDYDDRLIFEQDDARLGVRGRLGHDVSLDLSAGPAWGRSFFEANDANSRNVAKTDLTDSWITEARLSWRFP